MPTPRELLHVGTRAELAALGHSRREITAMIENGTVIPLGRSWLGTPQTPPAARTALDAGMRLTCLDALQLHGAQIPLTHGTHAVARQDTATAIPPGIVPHTPLASWPDREPVVPLGPALAHAARCIEPAGLGIVADSVAHLGLLERAELEEWIDSLPRRVRQPLVRIEALAESATESVVIRDLRRAGVTVRPQWFVPGVGRTDMLVGERLIIECDSVAHHTALPRYAADRRRDQRLIRLGYVVIRLTWEDVMLRWPETRSLLRDLIRREEHRVPRRQRAAQPR